MTAAQRFAWPHRPTAGQTPRSGRQPAAVSAAPRRLHQLVPFALAEPAVLLRHILTGPRDDRVTAAPDNWHFGADFALAVRQADEITSRTDFGPGTRAIYDQWRLDSWSR